MKIRLIYLLIAIPMLACGPQQRATSFPTATFEPVAFDIQTPTATVALLGDIPDTEADTPIPPPKEVSSANESPSDTESGSKTVPAEETQAEPPTDTPAPTDTPTEVPTETPTPVPPTATPAPTVKPLPAQRGGEWEFEAGFEPWTNPHGDQCAEGGLAIGWGAFTTRDQFGSSCFNRTTFGANVYMNESAQELTFAFVGNEAGIFKNTPTIPGHQYTVEAFLRREFSPSQVQVMLGVDLTGGTNWQAESVEWYPWLENLDDAWARTEQTVTATGDSLTVFIKGHHPEPVGDGALRLDNISVVDKGAE
ncbi:hypothetical protein QUF63_11245 [Anaerolineales bacterium HSG25]|nr:hypothetical protein [Anaerolineales bacterium HSG25]